MVNQNCSDAIEHCDTLCSVLHSNIEYELQHGMAPKIQPQHISHLFIHVFTSFIYEVGWVALVCLGFSWRAIVLV